MKLKEQPFFIYCSLCIFYPIGLIFLLKSSFSNRKKIIVSLIGAAIFICLLLIPLFNGRSNQCDPANFNVITTRKVLSVGQSGGFALYNGDDYYADFRVTCDNENILLINGNLYTAKSAGKCTLTVTFADQERKIDIKVTDHPNTSATVYITPSGTRYHNNEMHAGNTATTVTEEDALMSSKTPCKICFQ